MMESRMSQQTFESAHGLPQKQQWGLIYKHRAMQFEKAKSMEKSVAQQKKDTFREQLDKQIVSKNNVGIAEREEDKRYYQYVVKKAQQMKEKQEKDKFERFVKYKQLEEANQKLIESTSSPKQKDKNVYNLQIGLKSQIQKKQRAEMIRKDVINTLDQQKQWKEQERLKSREKEIQDFMKNQAYQQERFSNRVNTSKKYEQNQAVYNYYKELHKQKIMKEKDLQYKLVSQVQQKKQEQEVIKKQANMIEKQRKNLEMKDTLEKQLQLLSYKRRQQKITNPEQNSYSFINNIFRERKPTFDKREYSQFLQKQAEEQRLSKIQRQYMSQQQYKYNSNQLNKALSGTYTYDKYVDRSIGNLGNKLSVAEGEVIKGEDSEIVKARLEAIKNRNLSMVHSRSEMDRSFS